MFFFKQTIPLICSVLRKKYARYAFTFLSSPNMKNYKNLIITIGVFMLSILNVGAQTPPAPAPPPPPPGFDLPIGDKFQFILIMTVVFGLFIIHNKLKKQNSL